MVRYPMGRVLVAEGWGVGPRCPGWGCEGRRPRLGSRLSTSHPDCSAVSLPSLLPAWGPPLRSS